MAEEQNKLVERLNSEAFVEGLCGSHRYECWLFGDCTLLTRKRYVFCEYDNGVRLDQYFQETRKTKRHGWNCGLNFWSRQNNRASRLERPTEVPQICIDRAVEHFKGLIEYIE